jgi:hypothetical protein
VVVLHVFNLGDVASRTLRTALLLRRAPLRRSLRIGGARVPLVADYVSGYWDNNDFGWPWELWPWPPGYGCANTGRPPALFFAGAYLLASHDQGDLKCDSPTLTLL